MLNYNKIHSSINFDRTSKRKIAEFMGIPASTLRSRLEGKNLTPDDIEKLADFFEKPIAFYFDREEKEEKTYEAIEAKKDVVEESSECRMCVEKEKRIADKEEIINGLNKQIELLEFQLGKNLKTGSE